MNYNYIVVHKITGEKIGGDFTSSYSADKFCYRMNICSGETIYKVVKK